MKFPIRIDAIWRGPLLASAVTQGNSYVTLNEEGVHFRFGPLFNRTVPYIQIANVFPRSWPVLYGIGLRSNLRGVIGLIGSYHDVIEVRLTKRIRNWVLLFPCDRISVSLEDPERFVEELSRRIGLDHEPIEALAKPRRQPRRPKPATPASTVVHSPDRDSDPDTVSSEQPPIVSEPPTKQRGSALKAAEAPSTQTRAQRARAKPRSTVTPGKSTPAKGPPGSATPTDAPKRERRAPTSPTTNGRGAAKAGARAKQTRARRRRS